MGLPPTDFESVASAIPPLGRARKYTREKQKDGLGGRRPSFCSRLVLLQIPRRRPCGLNPGRTRGGGRSHLTTLAPLRPHLVHSLHEPFAQLLIAGPLHRIEIPAHLPILVPLDFEHLLPAGPHAIHEPAD